jgi:hypothetical protein
MKGVSIQRVGKYVYYVAQMQVDGLKMCKGFKTEREAIEHYNKWVDIFKKSIVTK